MSAALLPYLPYVAGSARHATSCPQTGQVDHDPHQGASRVSGCHTRATQRCRCRGRSSNARTGCALVPAHRQGRGTTTLTWGRGSPLLSLQGHKCLPTDRAGAPRTTHVEGAHHCYTAGSQVQATLPCTCGCQHWLIRSAILPVNADGLALCKPESACPQTGQGHHEPHMWKGLTTATQQGHECRQRCHAPADANTGLSADILTATTAVR